MLPSTWPCIGREIVGGAVGGVSEDIAIGIEESMGDAMLSRVHVLEYKGTGIQRARSPVQRTSSPVHTKGRSKSSELTPCHFGLQY